jgi:hypothetical protein
VVISDASYSNKFERHGLAISDWLYNCAAAEFNRTLGGVISKAARSC